VHQLHVLTSVLISLPVVEHHLISKASFCHTPGKMLRTVQTIIQRVSKKNIPDIFSRNSRKHFWIFIMFGTRY